MEEHHDHESHISDLLRHQIIAAISKPSGQRTYDDLLLLKSYMLETEFFEKTQLGNANPRQINDLCRGIDLEVHKVGDVVFNQGDIGDKVYIILFGKVEFIARFKIDLTQGQTEIREKKLDTFSSGRIFGERALQFDEPRSATAQCVEETYLITVDKMDYNRVLEDVRQDKSFNFRPDQLKPDQVSRETVMAILAKKRNRRTHQELEAAALYLCNRTKVESFQKLSMAQVVEVCRVAETLTIWGKSIVCKQGEVGPVFYAVLSGSVEVWVSKETPTSMPVRTGSRNQDVTEGLGRMENQLVTGKTFGDRALNSMDSLRKASIVTCEDATELLVIFRKDYENLIAATSQVETMAKVRLLRKTDLFHNLDMIHLRALANIMEPKTYGIDETVVMVGKRATEAIIVERGEMTVLTEVLEGYSKDGYDEMIAQQNYHHYLEDKHHHSHLSNDGRPIIDPPNYNHDKLKKMTVKKNEILETAKQDSQKHMQSKFQRMPSSLGNSLNNSTSTTSGGMSQDLHMNSTSTHGSQPFETAVRDSTSPNNGKRSAQDRKRNPRFQSTQLVPIGKRKKVTLGRIAPNSVLATYIMTCATQHDEVYHPETIVATALVNAYTVSKHAFFTSLPKDSKYAIVKLIKEYKAPVLTSLWENTPKVLDENQWKMDKTWKNFKSRFMEHGHKANILDSHKRMENLHISVNSGNDPGVKLMPRHYQFLNQNKDNGAALAMAILDPSKRKQEVTLDWGLPAKKDPNAAPSPVAAAAAAAVSDFTTTIHNEERLARASSPHVAHDQLRTHHHAHHHDEPVAGVILAPTLSASMSVPSLNNSQNYQPFSNKPEPLVSFRIRERLNLSRSMNALSDKQLSALTASHSETALLRNGSDGMSSPSGKSSSQSLSKKAKHIEMPFTLIQIHREVAKRNAINLASTSRRPLKSYVRICGSFPSCAKAKDMADLQMEQYYLQLYHSEATKEEELLLNWQTFNGYDAMALDATDHFLIYCRSTPVEFASLRPTKNIFNVRFPAMCKPQNQRYAVLVVNPLPPTTTEQLKRAQQQAQQQAGENPENSDTNSDDDQPRRRQISRKFQSKVMGMTAFGIGSSQNNNANSPTVGASFSTAVSHMSNVSNANNSTTLNSTISSAVANDFSDVNPSGLDKDGKPIHLTELSIVQETVAITSTRLEGLRYAIDHFGRVIPAKTTVSVNGVGHRLPATEFDATMATAAAMTTATAAAAAAAGGSGGVLSEEDAALHAAIMNTPTEQLDPQQQQLQEMLLATFVASQQMALNGEESSADAFRNRQEHEQYLSQAALAGKRRLGNRSVFVSPSKNNPMGNTLNTTLLSNDPNIQQSMAMGSITVILKPIASTTANNGGTASERVLRALYSSAQQNPTNPSQRLRVCVLPLFRWILIDGPTLDILDFTKAFHEDAIKNIFLAEQEEFIQQRKQLALSPRSAANSRANSRQQQKRPGSTGTGKMTMSMMMHGRQHQHSSVSSDGTDPLEDGEDGDEEDQQAEVFEYHGPTPVHNNNNASNGNGRHRQPHPASYQQPHHQQQQQQQAWTQEVNRYRDFTRELLGNKELPPELLSSMSEAGLLPKKTAKAVAVRFAGDHSSHAHHHSTSELMHHRPKHTGKLHATMSTSMSMDGFHPMSNNVTMPLPSQTTQPHDIQRLQILQQEIASQEIAQQLQQMQTKQAATISPDQLVETDPLINSLIDPTVAEDHNSVYHIAGGQRMSAIDKEIAVTGQQLSQTMAQLQTTIAMTGEALQVHDKLCDLEYATHNRFAQSTSAVAQQKSLEMLNRRMDVIEGFQKLNVTPSQPQPVTLFTLYQQATAAQNNPGSNHSSSASTMTTTTTTRRPQKGLISAKFTNNSGGNSSGNTASNNLGNNVNVAKRLNETLKVLSETIDGPYKKQQQELLRTKEMEQQEKANRLAKFSAGIDNNNTSINNNTNNATANTTGPTTNPTTSSNSNANSNNNPSGGNNTANPASSANSVVSVNNNSVPSLSKQVSQSSLALSI